METNKRKPNNQETNTETSGWKSIEFRKKVVKRMTDAIIKQGGPSQQMNLPWLIKRVESYEERVNASSKDEDEYIGMISTKINKICSVPQSVEPKPPLPNFSGLGKDLNIDWQEQVYQKVQSMRITYFTKLSAVYQHIISKLRQHEFSPQGSKTIDVEKFRKNKKYFEYIFAIFRVSKSQITIGIKDKVDQAEMFIHSVLHPRNVSSHQQVLTEQIPQQNKMCLQEQQVAKQNSKSPQSVNQMTIIKDKGKAVQQQTDNAQQPTKAFVASVNNLNEISHEPALISQDSSATMQDLIKVLTSMSPEALTASIGEVRELVHLYDVSQLIGGPPKIEEQKNMLQLIYGPPKMEEQPGLILEGRKMSRNITAMSFDAGEPNLNSFTSKVKHPRVEENIALLEEIKEINNLLLDTQVVIGEKDNIGSTAGGYAKQSEGLVVKFMFNAITVNQDLISRYGTDKKSIINPLWLLVPSNYPFSSPVILDDKPWEASSEDLKDLTVKAKAKLKFSFRSLNQPWSLKDIALSWERCAREAITEYAHAFGGGTFTSKYGGWETC